MSNAIAVAFFYGWIISFALLIYQSAILPGIRQRLRFRLFTLRDQLRTLVIEGKIRESDEAFALLHERLNFMCSSLARFDLVNALRAMKSIDDQDLEQVKAKMKVMEEAPPEVKEIFSSSVRVFVQAVLFNSIFLSICFLGPVSICMGMVMLLRVGFARLKDALIEKAREDGQLIFFRSAQVAV